jgi:hypothetical protein
MWSYEDDGTTAIPHYASRRIHREWYGQKCSRAGLDKIDVRLGESSFVLTWSRQWSPKVETFS